MPTVDPGAHRLKIGCSGWNYAHWRGGVFYPPRCAQRNWLRFYARHFDTVEVNMLREHGAALVIGDRPQVEFQAHELTADFTFVRFHGGSRGANGNYAHEELDEWAERLSAWSSEVDVFAYFNNDWQGYAIENALYLKGRLGQATEPGELLAVANAAAAQG